jgi:hypothetical protein
MWELTDYKAVPDRTSNERDIGLGARNTLHAVTLSNGPVYYGFLDRSTKDASFYETYFMCK